MYIVWNIAGNDHPPFPVVPGSIAELLAEESSLWVAGRTTARAVFRAVKWHALPYFSLPITFVAVNWEPNSFVDNLHGRQIVSTKQGDYSVYVFRLPDDQGRPGHPGRLAAVMKSRCSFPWAFYGPPPFGDEWSLHDLAATADEHLLEELKVFQSASRGPDPNPCRSRAGAKRQDLAKKLRHMEIALSALQARGTWPNGIRRLFDFVPLCDAAQRYAAGALIPDEWLPFGTRTALGPPIQMTPEAFDFEKFVDPAPFVTLLLRDLHDELLTMIRHGQVTGPFGGEVSSDAPGTLWMNEARGGTPTYKHCFVLLSQPGAMADWLREIVSELSRHGREPDWNETTTRRAAVDHLFHRALGASPGPYLTFATTCSWDRVKIGLCEAVPDHFFARAAPSARPEGAPERADVVVYRLCLAHVPFFLFGALVKARRLATDWDHVPALADMCHPQEAHRRPGVRIPGQNTRAWTWKAAAHHLRAQDRVPFTASQRHILGQLEAGAPTGVATLDAFPGAGKTTVAIILVKALHAVVATVDATQYVSFACAPTRHLRAHTADEARKWAREANEVLELGRGENDEDLAQEYASAEVERRNPELVAALKAAFEGAARANRNGGRFEDFKRYVTTYQRVLWHLYVLGWPRDPFNHVRLVVMTRDFFLKFASGTKLPSLVARFLRSRHVLAILGDELQTWRLAEVVVALSVCKAMLLMGDYGQDIRKNIAYHRENPEWGEDWANADQRYGWRYFTDLEGLVRPPRLELQATQRFGDNTCGLLRATILHYANIHPGAAAPHEDSVHVVSFAHADYLTHTAAGIDGDEEAPVAEPNVVGVMVLFIFEEFERYVQARRRDAATVGHEVRGIVWYRGQLEVMGRALDALFSPEGWAVGSAWSRWLLAGAFGEPVPQGVLSVDLFYRRHFRLVTVATILRNQVEASLVIAFQRRLREQHFPKSSLLGDEARLGVVLTRHTRRLVVLVDGVAGHRESPRAWRQLVGWPQGTGNVPCAQLRGVPPFRRFTQARNSPATEALQWNVRQACVEATNAGRTPRPATCETYFGRPDYALGYLEMRLPAPVRPNPDFTDMYAQVARLQTDVRESAGGTGDLPVSFGHLANTAEAQRIDAATLRVGTGEELSLVGVPYVSWNAWWSLRDAQEDEWNQVLLTTVFELARGVCAEDGGAPCSDGNELFVQAHKVRTAVEEGCRGLSRLFYEKSCSTDRPEACWHRAGDAAGKPTYRAYWGMGTHRQHPAVYSMVILAKSGGATQVAQHYFRIPRARCILGESDYEQPFLEPEEEGGIVADWAGPAEQEADTV